MTTTANDSTVRKRVSKTPTVVESRDTADRQKTQRLKEDEEGKPSKALLTVVFVAVAISIFAFFYAIKLLER